MIQEVTARLVEYMTPAQQSALPRIAVNVPRTRPEPEILKAFRAAAAAHPLPPSFFEPRMLARIQATVAAHYGLTVEALVSSSRRSKIARPRFVAIWIARRLTHHSLCEIGRRFGGRDHVTVINALRKTEQRLQANPLFAAEVSLIESELRAANDARPQ